MQGASEVELVRHPCSPSLRTVGPLPGNEIEPWAISAGPGSAPVNRESTSPNTPPEVSFTRHRQALLTIHVPPPSPPPSPDTQGSGRHVRLGCELGEFAKLPLRSVTSRHLSLWAE